MLEDPDLQELVSALRNGHTASVFAAPKHKFSGGLSAAIVALRSELTKQFSAPEVQRRLEEHSFQFNSGDHRSAVRDALFRLVDTKQIKLVVKGKGGQPSVFEWP